MELTAPQKLVCKMAVDKLGRRHQLFKVVEELRELADVLEEAAVSGFGSAEHIIDERADVAIVLYQLDALIMPKTVACVPAHIPRKIHKLEQYLEAENG